MPGNFRSDLEPRKQVMPAAPVKPMPAPTAQVMPAAPTAVPTAPMPGGPMPGQVPSMGYAAPAAPVAPRKMKKGGCVKKMAKGGGVSSASKRGDGIAVKGKTRGKIV